MSDPTERARIVVNTRHASWSWRTSAFGPQAAGTPRRTEPMVVIPNSPSAPPGWKAITVSPHTTPSPLLLGSTNPDTAHWVELPALRTSVKVARNTMGERLTAWRLPCEVREDAVLLLSELATNAVLHTVSTRILCGVGLMAEGGLRLEVHDQDRTGRLLPRRDPGPDDENGRGLLLVQHMADTWGVDRSTFTGGHAVWATLTTAL
ncbi:ATP-binding protein [Streptomyces phaeochromogenes]|uniref:ATP-binding protein n=1 Tax=Streptomyces phaeochromogenes TaxID=1923 RepID=UPI0027D7890E|nr:ATP-binding protein [Streptomyces phaeochromogenes]